MTISERLGNNIINYVLRSEVPEKINKIFVSLHTADPGATGKNEITAEQWPSYTRIDVSTNGDQQGFSRAVSKTASNNLKILWPPLDGQSHVIASHFGLWDGEHNFLYGAAFVAPKKIYPKDQCIIFADQLVFTLE
ncbi:phage tail fiber protein [Bartonella apis]|uniref:phage tail fiber protein n=1 Tax=Bartonella apis TaxID=1686310 RepID=UPI0024328A49|nr:hypothetical protein [Bartonella apis]